MALTSQQLLQGSRVRCRRQLGFLHDSPVGSGCCMHQRTHQTHQPSVGVCWCRVASGLCAALLAVQLPCMCGRVFSWTAERLGLRSAALRRMLFYGASYMRAFKVVATCVIWHFVMYISRMPAWVSNAQQCHIYMLAFSAQHDEHAVTALLIFAVLYFRVSSLSALVAVLSSRPASDMLSEWLCLLALAMFSCMDATACWFCLSSHAPVCCASGAVCMEAGYWWSMEEWHFMRPPEEGELLIAA